MGKIERSDQFRRPAHRAPRRVKSRWNPSGATIFNIGIVALAAFWVLSGNIEQDFAVPSWNATTDSESASFEFCYEGGGTNCVVDGDTIWYRGNNIRIADIDTPETHSPSCAQEAELGEEATDRLHALLNDGEFSVQSYDRDTDRYGRQLRILTRSGKSIGGMLVDDGLARWYAGGRKSWC